MEKVTNLSEARVRKVFRQIALNISSLAYWEGCYIAGKDTPLYLEDIGRRRGKVVWAEASSDSSARQKIIQYQDRANNFFKSIE